jgi:hypothetical protein
MSLTVGAHKPCHEGIAERSRRRYRRLATLSLCVWVGGRRFPATLINDDLDVPFESGSDQFPGGMLVGLHLFEDRDSRLSGSQYALVR